MVEVDSSDAEVGETQGDPTGGRTLDELEQASGVPARTIRFYRQSGLIGPPRRVGRRAFYDAEQLRRLKLIAALRERGLGLEAVAKILADPEAEQRAFTGLMEIDDLLEPWIDDHPRQTTVEELLGLVGATDERILAQLERRGFIARNPDDPITYVVPSVATLELSVEMREAGVQQDVITASWDAMQRHVAALADELVVIFAEHPGFGFGPSVSSDKVNAAFRRIRPVALQGIQVAFAHEIERALSQYIEGWNVVDVTDEDDDFTVDLSDDDPDTADEEP
jgi:DNA-binding transcriptional MerR regulator